MSLPKARYSKMYDLFRVGNTKKGYQLLNYIIKDYIEQEYESEGNGWTNDTLIDVEKKLFVLIDNHREIGFVLDNDPRISHNIYPMDNINKYLNT